MKQKTTYEQKALAMLRGLSRSAMAAKSPEDVFRCILDRAMLFMGVTKASIMRFDPEEKVLRIIAERGIPKEIAEKTRIEPGRGISGKVFKSGRPLLVADAAKRADTLKSGRYKGGSLISAPAAALALKVRGRPVGVINMTDKKGGGAFTQADLDALTVIAGHAAAYIHIYNLIEELRGAEQLKMEMETARDVQSALLPRRLPKLSGVTAAGRLIMAERIGGDYYDVLASGRSPPAFVVADVSGHDIGAALLMSAFRSALRSEAGIPVLPPSSVLRRLNKTLFDDLCRAEQFISVAYMQYIHSSRTLRWSTAGHHPVLLYRRADRSFSMLDTEGPLVGVERGEHFYDRKCAVEKGDVAVMFTDGVVEAEGAKGRFGMERLKRAAAKLALSPPKAIVAGISREVGRFTAPARLKDDAALLVLKFW